MNDEIVEVTSTGGEGLESKSESPQVQIAVESYIPFLAPRLDFADAKASPQTPAATDDSDPRQILFDFDSVMSVADSALGKVEVETPVPLEEVTASSVEETLVAAEESNLTITTESIVPVEDISPVTSDEAPLLEDSQDLVATDVAPVEADAASEFENDPVEVLSLESAMVVEDESISELAPGTREFSDEDYQIEDEVLLGEIKAIPDKLAFKIGEVADLLGIKQYVLRYWEGEFEALKPKKSAHNQRMYSRRDVETAFMIKKLLYRDRFSIEGARKALRSLKKKVKNERTWESSLHKFQDAKQNLLTLADDIARLRERWLQG